MGVDSKHPLFTEHQSEWEQMRDTARGQRVVKEAGFKYLPATSGMIKDGAEVAVDSVGFKAYEAYRTRAVFPDLVDEAIDAMLGVMHNKPPKIELPSVMEPMLDRATIRNESLVMLLRRINEEQLTTGRLGLLADVIDRGERQGQPYIVTYNAEHITNWDEGQLSREVDEEGNEVEVTEPQNLNFVALDESGEERQADFEWRHVTKFRVLSLGDPLANEPEGEGVYRVGVFRDNVNFNPEIMEEPQIAGNLAGEIPFVFVNTKDIVPEPDEPPLLGLSDLALTIYRGEADYRQALFMQGQDTLVTIGGTEDEEYRLGAGASINIPNTSGDAKFIGVDSTGLPEMRSALENDYKRASVKAGTMLETTSREAESGEALKIRVSARTATLNQIALSGAFALEQILKKIARWMGANDEEVVVEPNMDFVDDQLTGQTLVQFMTAISMGAPWSLESLHSLMQERGLTDKTFEEELAVIEGEQDLNLVPTSNPEGPEEDEPADDDNADDEGSPADGEG